MAGSTVALLLAAASIPVAHAQDISYWINPRAAVVRNQVYISGGDRFDGDATNSSRTDATGGSLYNISLCDSFNTNSTGKNAIPLVKWGFDTSPSPPFFVGGAMYATDDLFYTYGGMKSSNNSDDNGVIFAYINQSDPSQSGWSGGVQTNWEAGGASSLADTTRYVAQGSWISAPSENLGFWFGGMRTANNTDVNYVTSEGDPDQPNTPATDFYMFNLDENAATYKNMTWPSTINPRAEGGLVWLPYGNKGMLLAFGGIVIPTDMSLSGLNPTYDSSNETNTYMTSILVYDIDSDTWEAQQTDRSSPDSPGTLASFCTVVASAPDNSSHHVYVYGGYDGTYTDGSAYDTVWVLSIPAFRWTKLSDGTPDHRRQNHVCVKANANSMLSIGGGQEYGTALAAPAFDVFNLSTAEWTSTYDPNPSAVYEIPPAVSSNVVNMNTIPDNLVSQVKSWLGIKYQGHISGTILDGCPIRLSNGTVVTPTPTPVAHKSSDSWKTPVAAAVASVGGVAIIAGLLWCFCIRKRRRSNHSEDTKRNSILSWVNRSSPAAPKSMPDSENTVIATPVDYFGNKGHQVEAYEMPSNVPSPGYNSYGHGSPQIVPGGSATSPFMGSAEVDAQSRHELMDNSSRGASTFGPDPYSMRSVSGRNNLMSVRSDSVSHASDAVMPSRHYGYVSPYEMAHDRSHEDLASPPADLLLNEPRAEGNKNASTHSLGVGAEKVNSPVMMTPIAPITRTIDSASSPQGPEPDRPRHQRNQSTMSSNLPNLPSPRPEEDRRRSRLLETLPDPSSTQSSPTQPQTAKKSVYTENLDA